MQNKPSLHISAQKSLFALFDHQKTVKHHQRAASTQHTMDLSKIKSLAFLAIFFLFSLYVKTSVGRPTTSLSQKTPKFLWELYYKIINSVSRLPAQTVHGIFARVKPFHGGAKHSTDVTLFANIALASVKKTKETNLHVHLESTANNSSTVAAFGKQQLVQASSCKLHIHNVKTNKEITMKRISCTESRTYIIALTSFVNKWLKSTSTTLAVRVRISSNSSNVPTAMLPFINSSSHVEQPYYILYV